MDGNATQDYAIEVGEIPKGNNNKEVKFVREEIWIAEDEGEAVKTNRTLSDNRGLVKTILKKRKYLSE